MMQGWHLEEQGLPDYILNKFKIQELLLSNH